MAAYAALASLINTMDLIHIHPRFSTCFQKKDTESLADTLGFLLDFVEKYNGSGGGSKEMEDLEEEIASAAHAAEDVIESYIVDLIHAESRSHKADQICGGLLQKIIRPKRKMLPRVICSLQKVTEDMNSVKDTVRMIQKQVAASMDEIESAGHDAFENVTHGFKHHHSTPLTPAASSTADKLTGKTSMVGFDDYFIQVMDKLISGEPKKQAIPIVGMGGVGKTTLVRYVFDKLRTDQHFDLCAWVTVSQNYSRRDILLQLLSGYKDIKELIDLDECELGVKLHQCLYNRRYLIILDDIWTSDVCDQINSLFRDNNNCSRVVVTTRLVDIALYFNSGYRLTLNLMDGDNSWNLFCQESFGEEGCPTELEHAGKRICENCKGLPLSIVVIGGFLQKSSKAKEYWERVARDTYSILNSEDGNQCMNILSFSYIHLPAHLKPCFLYMSVFPEDEVICVSRLTKLWVAEKFLKPNMDGGSLEEVGKGYLKDLADRNLIFINKLGRNGKMKACGIHDLIREFCLRVAKKEKFVLMLKCFSFFSATRDLNRGRHIVIHERMSLCDAMGSAPIVRSLISTDNAHCMLKSIRC